MKIITVIAIHKVGLKVGKILITMKNLLSRPNSRLNEKLYAKKNSKKTLT